MSKTVTRMRYFASAYAAGTLTTKVRSAVASAISKLVSTCASWFEVTVTAPAAPACTPKMTVR